MASWLGDDAVSALDRFESLKAEQPHLALFAVVDGLLYEQTHGERLASGQGSAALFDGTDDSALAWAGPWVVDAEQMQDLRDQLLVKEGQAPHVSWIIASLPFDGLVQLLRLKLDVRLPDGSIGLLRFYDPRVLYSLATTLTVPQREEFFGHIMEWHFRHDGQAMRIGRADA